MRETCLQGFANNKGADQPAHSRSPISAFVIRLLGTRYERNLNFLASLCRRAGWFESHIVRNPKDKFCRVEAQLAAYQLANVCFTAPPFHQLICPVVKASIYFKSRWYARIQGRGAGVSYPRSWTNHKNIGFLSNTVRIPRKITKQPSYNVAFNVGPSSARQRNAIKNPF